MIEPLTATTIIIGFLITFAIIIPVCGVIPKLKEIISLRYLIVVVFLACMIGVVINYKELDVEIKKIVIIGSTVLSILYVLIRSIEKVIAKGWLKKTDVTASITKGELEAKIELKTKESEKDDFKGLAAYERPEEIKSDGH